MYYFYKRILPSIVEQVYGAGSCIMFLMCMSYLLTSSELHTGTYGGCIT